MNFRKNPALWTSVILHLVVLLVLCLATIIETLRPKKKPHVFEMVSVASQQMSQTPAATDPFPAIEAPTVEPLPPVPELTIPKPQPTPRPQPQPTPTPKKPKTISYEDFLKNNKIPDPKPRPPKPTQPFLAPTINTSQLQSNLQSLLQNQAQVDASMSPAMQDALARYGSQLNARLNRAWIKPPNLAGVRLVATAVFDVSKSGQISNLHLRPPSGNAAFDASVKAAFAKVASFGAPPTGDAHSFTMTFRMVD